MADLRGRIAVVTGASRGVGRGIAEGLAEAGATVYLTGRTSTGSRPPEPGTLEAAAAEVAALGGQAIPVQLDHRDDGAVAALFRRIEAESGRLDVLVNNAYPRPKQGMGSRFWELAPSVWDDQFAVGLRGYYVAAALGARLMVEQGSGLIINVSSPSGDDYLLNTVYGVSKAGTDRMARDMARELKDHGVAALALVPGKVRAGMRTDRSAGGEGAGTGVRLHAPRYVGRSVAALAMDPDIMEKSGGRYRVDELVREYRFTEPGRELA